MPNNASLSEFFFRPIVGLFEEAAAGNLYPLGQSLLFSAALLTILAAHEFGHYFACRYYGIRATLPFFLPAPPVISLFGTFGAVIKIKAPITTRRALFDIGIAGPLAGFIVALPVSLIGLLIATPDPHLPPPGSEVFADPTLFKLIVSTFGLPTMWDWNPFIWAAWGTLLVTALNLFPVGQLDGGHVLYAVFGHQVHKWVSRLVVVATICLSVVAVLQHQLPVYAVWTLVLLFLLKVGHPPVFEHEPLGKGRIALAILAILVFILCFLPFPITTILENQ